MNFMLAQASAGHLLRGMSLIYVATVIVSLVCWGTVVVKVFRSGNTGMGIFCIVPIVAFFYGWAKNATLQIRTVLIAWTGAIALNAMATLCAVSVLNAANPDAAAEHLDRLFATTAFIIAAALFILALKWLSAPTTARRGNYAGELGMLLAIVGALLNSHIITYNWIILGFVIGGLIGAPMAIWMPMTAVPQRTALSHAFGGLAAVLVGTAHFYLFDPATNPIGKVQMGILALEVLLGGLTLTGSSMAFGKLQELLPTRPITYPFQNALNFTVLGLAITCGLILTINPASHAVIWIFPILIVLSMAFGLMLIVPIGGADMPTVIALLNSYAGLSASMMGFVLGSKLLILAGALDGASGLILSIVMCKAMNRSFTNVLFGAFGQIQQSAAAGEKKPVRSAGPEEIAGLLESAQSVIVIPGYGMAVAQAQHKVRELYDQLTKKGVGVKFAIHPVAGRMPGHMNVLLAEAEIPYDKLVEMDDINDEFAQTDIALVIGANDVVNPAARHDKTSPIYGMPILNADKARTVVAIKRSMNPGFAGIENELYTLDHTLMLFGDAKKVIGETAKELSDGKH